MLDEKRFLIDVIVAWSISAKNPLNTCYGYSSSNQLIFRRKPNFPSNLINNPPAMKDIMTNNPPTMEDMMTNNPPAMEDIMTNNLPAMEDIMTNNLPAVEDIMTNNPPAMEDIMTNNPPAIEDITYSELVSKHLCAMHKARKAFIEAESNDKLRRALKTKPRVTTDTTYDLGDPVYHKRKDSEKWKATGKIIEKKNKQLLVKHSGYYIRVHPWES